MRLANDGAKGFSPDDTMKESESPGLRSMTQKKVALEPVV